MSNRSVARLSAGMETKLAAYAAAGASVLATGFSPSARAGIIYTKVQTRCSFPGIDLNHDGIADFSLEDFHGGTSFRFGDLLVSAVSPNQFAVSVSHKPAALDGGDVIGPHLSFADGLGPMASLTSFYDIGGGWIQVFVGGNFANVHNKFLALRIMADGQTHYGWARIDNEANTEFGKFACELVDYAYEAVPDTPIIAGQGIKPNLQPDTLGWMAVGSDGLAVLRNQTRR